MRISTCLQLLLIVLAAMFPSFTAVGERRVTRPAEIAVLGGNHLAYLFDADYTPAHLRALLTKIRPDVIAIENLPEWQDKGKLFWIFLPEYCVAFSYAQQKGIPVVGVDFNNPADRDAGCLQMRKHRESTVAAERKMQWAKLLESIGEWHASLLFQQSPGGIDSVYQSFAEESSDPEMIRRDDRIAANIIQVAKQFTGKRMAVILGAYHLGPQSRRLGREATVRLLNINKSFLPLCKEEVETSWQKTDYYLVLGASLDSYLAPGVLHMRNHQRSRELLDRFKAMDPASALTRYYEAKWHLIFARYDKAEALLWSIIAEESREQVPCHPCSEWSWPPWPRVYDKATFTLATILDRAGKREQAIALYKRLQATLPSNQLRPRFRGPGVYYDLRWYLESLTEEPYGEGAREAFRAREARRCWLAAETPEDAWPD